MAAKPADVMSSERHTVKPWLNARLPYSPVVIDLASEGFPLIGSRVDVIATAPSHVISVFAMPNLTNSEAVRALPIVNGYNVVAWHKGGNTYWAVSDLNAAELQSFADKFQAASL